MRVHVFPADDGLTRDVVRAWRRLDTDRADADTFRNDLELLLRRWYPRLAIQTQSDFASLISEEEVWYVFRDGRVSAPVASRDELYAAMSRARDMADSISDALRGPAAATADPERPRPVRERQSSSGGNGR